LYGSGDISQGFCRICAVYKGEKFSSLPYLLYGNLRALVGVYMLNTHIIGFLEKPCEQKDMLEKDKKQEQNACSSPKSKQLVLKSTNQLTLSEPQQMIDQYKTLLLSNSLHVNVKRIITSSKQFQLEIVPKLTEYKDINVIPKTLNLFKKKENVIEYIRCVAILSSNVLPETPSEYGANFSVFLSTSSSPVHLLELGQASGCTAPNYVLLHMTQRLNRDEYTPQETSLHSECPYVYSKLEKLLKQLLTNR
jgi:hypothetical protein